MGSVSEMHTANQVIERHGDELRAEVYDALPRALRDMEPTIVLTNDIRGIGVELWIGDGFLELRPFDLVALHDRFPDC